MPQVLGIDLGAFSVKVAVANAGLRNADVVEVIERRVPDGDEPHEVRAGRVLAEILAASGLESATHYAAVSGDHVFVHILDLAVRGLRRADLDRVVGAELEDVLPIDLDEMVYAFETLPREVAAAHATDGDPSFVHGAGEPRVQAPEPTGTRVLACAMPRERARELLSRYEESGANPRGLVAAPESYMRLIGKLDMAAPGPMCVIDLGHARTDVCVIAQGRTVFARTVAKGGRDLTRAIASAWRLAGDDAERLKHESGVVGSQAEPLPSEEHRPMHDVLGSELASLGRDLRRTLTMCRAKAGVSPGQVILVGGGSRLRGIGGYLSEALGLPTRTLGPEDHARVVAGGEIPRTDIGAVAIGVALEGATGRPVFDLRKGDLAYRTDLSFLRAKAGWIAAAAVVVLAFAVANAYAAYYRLRKEEAALVQRVAVDTTALFGKPLSAQDAIDRTGGAKSHEDSPLPERSAYDMLLLLNAQLPAPDKIVLDVTKLKIEPGEIRLDIKSQSTEGIDAVEAIGAMEKSIAKHSCFEDISRGDISSQDDNTATSSFTIETKCNEIE